MRTCETVITCIIDQQKHPGQALCAAFQPDEE